MNRLQEIRARVEAAHQNYESVRHYSESRPLPGHWIYGYGAHGTGDANVKDDIPYLLSLVERLEAVVEAARNLCPSEPSFDDPRISWVEVQIERTELAAFRAALTAVEEK